MIYSTLLYSTLFCSILIIFFYFKKNPFCRTFSLFANTNSHTIHLDQIPKLCSNIYQIPDLITYDQKDSQKTTYFASKKVADEFQKICFEQHIVDIDYPTFHRVMKIHNIFLLPVFEFQRKIRIKVFSILSILCHVILF